MKKLRRGMILLLVVSLMMSMVACSEDVKTDLSPEEHVYEAYMKTFSTGAMDVTGTLEFDMKPELLANSNLDLDFDDPAMALVNDLGFKFNYKMRADLPKKVLDYDLNYLINYKDKEILDASIFLNMKEAGLVLKNFYDKPFVVNFESVADAIMAIEGAELLGDIDFEKYFQVIFTTVLKHQEDLNNDNYLILIKEHLKTHLSEGVNEVREYEKHGEAVSEHVLTYEYSMNMEDMLDLFKALAMEAQKDEAVKVVYKDVAKALLDEFIESEDYLLFDLTAPEVSITDEEFDAVFDEAWDSFFTGFLSEMDNSMATYSEDTLAEVQALYDQMKYKIYINGDGFIIGTAMEANSPEIAYNVDYVINAIGDDVVIDKHSSDGIDVMTFIDFENETVKNKEALAKLIPEVMLSFIDELENGEGLTLLLSDIVKIDGSEAEFNEFKDSLKEARTFVEETNWLEYLDLMFYSYDDYDYDDSDVSYTSEYPELQGIAVVNIDADETFVASLQESADMRAVPLKIYNVTDPADESIYQKAYDEGATLIFINDDRLQPAAFNVAMNNSDIQIIALFEKGFDDSPMNMPTTMKFYEEPGYIAGYIAAKQSATGKIGFIAGTDDYDTQNFAYAYNLGAVTANPDIEVVVKHIESDEDMTGAKQATTELKDAGVDVVYHDAGKAGESIIDTADALNIWAIGNRSDYGKEKKNLLTYHVDNDGFMAEYILGDYDYGYLEYNYYFGISEETLSFEQVHLDDALWLEVSDLIDQIYIGDLYIESYWPE